MDSQYLDYLKNQFARGRMSRREFMGRVSAVGVTAAVAASVLGAAETARAATPKRGGSARFAMGNVQTGENLDPLASGSNTAHMRAMTGWNPLVKISPDFEAQPELATSWESTPDAKQWTFKIRQGVEFHDGKSMTTADVAHSLRRHTGQKTESQAKSLFKGVTEVKAVDASTVRVTLSSANVDFPLYLGQQNIGVVPEDLGAGTGGKGVGTGPFRLKEFKPGISSTWVRNENYWKDGFPYLDEVEIFPIIDRTARTNAIMSGDIDVMSNCDPKTVSLLRRTPGVEVVSTKAGSHTLISCQTELSPADNADLRLALKYSMDREKTLRSVYKGLGQLGNDHNVHPQDPFYCKDLAQRTYDPDKARFHIKKAGLENTEIPIFTSETPGPGAIEVAELIQQTAKAAGINIKVNRVPADTYWSNTWLKQPIVVSGWNGRPTADLMMTAAHTAGARFNESRWENPRFSELLVAARGELDKSKRAAMYCEMQTLMHNDGGVVGPTFFDYIDATRDYVKGYVPNGTGTMGGFQIAEFIWLDK